MLLVRPGPLDREGTEQMSDQSYLLRAHNGKELQILNASPYDGDVRVRVEGDEERCVTFGRFEEGPGGSYGWRVVPPPGEGWTLDREASARKDFRVAYWRRPRVRFRAKRTLEQTSPNDRD